MTLPYRENVCLIIFKDKEHIFIGERAGEDGTWQLPQGGVEPELSIEKNVLKEAHEELGAKVELFQIEKQLRHTHRYDFDNPPKYAIDKFRGQSQTFWLVRFKGIDSDINLEFSDKEFQNWRWVNVSELKSHVEKKRLPGYEPALLEFIDHFRCADNV